MEVRCPSCATRYSIPDDKVRGRRGRFPCHRCGTKVPIDGTLVAEPGAAGGPDASPASGQLASKVPVGTRPLPPIVSPPKPAALPPVGAQPEPGGGALGLSRADEEDAATRMVTALPPVPRPVPLPRPAVPRPPVVAARPASPASELSDAIDEDEATRMVSIIGTGGLIATVPQQGNDELTIRAPMDGPGGILAAVQAAQEAALRSASASAAGSELARAGDEDDDATHMMSAHGAAALEAAAAAPAPAPAPAEPPARPRSRTQEVTGQTRIVVRTQAPPPKPIGGVQQVLILLAAACVGGFVVSQVMNARRAQTPHVIRPMAADPARAARPFEEIAARAALLAAASTAGAACRAPGQPAGEVVVGVRFLPSGRASDSKVEGPLGPTETGLCIARQFAKVSIDPFAGAPVALSTRVVIP